MLMGAMIASAQPPQAGTNFLQDAFGRQPLSVNPLLSAEFPRVSLLFANRAVQVEASTAVTRQRYALPDRRP